MIKYFHKIFIGDAMQKNFNTTNQSIIDRAYMEAIYISKNKCTLREVADYAEVCLKTTHYDLMKVLPFSYPNLASKVQKHLDSNKKDSVFRASRASAEKVKKCIIVKRRLYNLLFICFL